MWQAVENITQNRLKRRPRSGARPLDASPFATGCNRQYRLDSGDRA